MSLTSDRYGLLNSIKSASPYTKGKPTAVGHAIYRTTRFSFKFTSRDVTSDVILVDKMHKSGPDSHS